MSKIFHKLAAMSSNGLIPRSINYFSTLCRSLPSSLPNSSTTTTTLLPSAAACENNHASILRSPAILQQSVRGKKVVVYKANVWKRVHVHSLHRRILTKGGIETIWKRLIKGRHVLVPYDGFLFDNSKKTKSSLTQPKIFRENRFIKKRTVKKTSYLHRQSDY